MNDNSKKEKVVRLKQYSEIYLESQEIIKDDIIVIIGDFHYGSTT